MLTFCQYSLPNKLKSQNIARWRELAEQDKHLKYVSRAPNEIHISGKSPKDVHFYQVDENNNIQNSCCGGFNFNERSHVEDGIMESGDARKLALTLGRFACGRCVASLYGNADCPEHQTR